MDDFGVGYSSLAHLKHLPVHFLKIDRSFMRDVVADASDQAIVASIVSVAKTFGLSVVAEGVESDGQAAVVTLLGCDGGQGFWYGKPQGLPAFEALLAAERRPEAVELVDSSLAAESSLAAR